MELTKTRLHAGTWEGVLSQPATAPVPDLTVTLDGAEVEGVTLHETGTPGDWSVKIPVAASDLSDGVRTYLIADARTGERMGSFTLIVDEAMADDLRAEIDLLRAELDMLKRAFRRHCVETA